MPTEEMYESYGSGIRDRSSASSEIREPRNIIHSSRYTNRNRQSSNLHPSDELDNLIEETINKPYQYMPFDRYRSPSELRVHTKHSNKSVVGCSYPYNTNSASHQYSHLSNATTEYFSEDDILNRDQNYESNINLSSRSQEGNRHFPYSSNTSAKKIGVNDRRIDDKYTDDDTQYDRNLFQHDHLQTYNDKSLSISEDYKSHLSHKDNQNSPILNSPTYGNAVHPKSASTNSKQSVKALRVSNYLPSPSSTKSSTSSRRPFTLSKIRNPSNISEITDDSIASVLPDDRIFLLPKTKSEASLAATAATAAAYLLSEDKRDKRKLYDFHSAVRSVSDLLVEKTNSQTISKIKVTTSEEDEENQSYFPVSFLKMQESVRRDIMGDSAKKPGKSFHMNAYQFWAELTLLVLLEVLTVYPQNQEVTHLVADAVMIHGVSTIRHDWLKSGEDDIALVAIKVAERILSSTEGSEKVAFTVIATLFKEGGKILQKERVLKNFDDSTFHEKIRHSIHSNDNISKRTDLIIQKAKANILQNTYQVDTESRNSGASSRGTKSSFSSESRAEKVRRMRAEKVDKTKAYLAKSKAENNSGKMDRLVEDASQNISSRSRGASSHVNSESKPEKVRRMRAEKVEKSKAYIAKMNAEKNLANTSSVAATDQSVKDASSEKTASHLYRTESHFERKQPKEHQRMARAANVLKTKAYIAIKSAADRKQKDGVSSGLGGSRSACSNPVTDVNEEDSIQSSNSSKFVENIKIDRKPCSSHTEFDSFPDDSSRYNQEMFDCTTDNASNSSSKGDTQSQIRDQIMRIQMRAAQNNAGISQEKVHILTPKQMEVENDHINTVLYINKKNEVTAVSDNWLISLFDKCCGGSIEKDNDYSKQKRPLARKRIETNHINSVQNQNGGLYDRTWSSDFSSKQSQIDRMTSEVDDLE